MELPFWPAKPFVLKEFCFQIRFGFWLKISSFTSAISVAGDWHIHSVGWIVFARTCGALAFTLSASYCVGYMNCIWENFSGALANTLSAPYCIGFMNLIRFTIIRTIHCMRCRGQNDRTGRCNADTWNIRSPMVCHFILIRSVHMGQE